MKREENASGVLLLSGGVDSAFLLFQERLRLAVFVDYGQPAAADESRAAHLLATYRGCSIQSVALKNAPLGDMGSGTAAHVVPARNLWLISLAFAHCLPGEDEDVWIGAAPNDEADYADCRCDFLDAFGDVSKSLGFGRVRYSHRRREERVFSLLQEGVLHLTQSCYYGDPACGECPSCLQ